MYLIFAVIMLAASALVVIRLPKPKNATPDRKSGRDIGFRGFSIEPGGDCCQASSVLKKVTFAHRDWITLPLSSCDKRRCHCQKTEVKERRNYHRRSSMDRRKELRFDANSKDRRIKKGRREHDKLWSGGYLN